MPRTYFHMRVEAAENIAVEEIWPDGDAPEDPTPEDAHAKLLESCPDAEMLAALRGLNFGLRVT